jgi:hypothetical protein
LTLEGSLITKTGGLTLSEDRLILGMSGSSESVLDGLDMGSSGTTIMGISALMTEIMGMLLLADLEPGSSGIMIVGIEGGPCWERGSE